ncbi:MAG: YceI family protein [Ignavibacteriae bacterium]|nr:YceI family protein [Ignavibacteria bacterium]MBI3363869.1 YceI family protein [Ignavibacteriota bacterium]
MIKRIASIILLNGLLVSSLWAQSGTRTQLTVSPESKLVLNGNSTMHEYSTSASQLSGTIMVDSLLFVEGKRDLSKPFHSVEITIPVKKMLSGNEKLDNNLYDALKADDHPDITYRMTDDSVIAAGNDSLTVRTAGTLAVAGKEKVIDMVVTVLKNHDSTLSINGSKELLMTDFDVDPPSMMLGLLKTDNAVVIHFNLRVQHYVQQ